MSSNARASRPGPPPTNVVWVAERLREEIVKGRLRGGERIKEAPLSQELGVSRGPIRDALRILQAEGLVALQPNRGAIVPEVRASDLVEVALIRQQLGALALRAVVPSADLPAALASLDGPLRRLERAAGRDDARRATEADLSFQDAVVAAAGMPRLAREFERLTWQLRMFIATLDLRDAESPATVLEDVRALHAAIAAQDAEGALRLWAGRFEHWLNDVVRRLPEDDALDAHRWAALSR